MLSQLRSASRLFAPLVARRGAASWSGLPQFGNAFQRLAAAVEAGMLTPNAAARADRKLRAIMLQAKVLPYEKLTPAERVAAIVQRQPHVLAGRGGAEVKELRRHLARLAEDAPRMV